MRIHHLDKRSAAYREFSGQIGSLGRQACASLNGNDILKRRIGEFLKGPQLQCNTLGGIIRDIRAEGLNDIANETDRLRVEIAGAVETEIREFKSRQAIGRETARPATQPDLKPRIHGNSVSRELSEMKRTGKFDAERIGEILEAEIGIIALTQCFNILGILGIKTVGEKIVRKAIDKAVNMAHILDSQAVANVLNALPKLGERRCPAELKERAIAVSGSMNSQEVANVLNALPKLGERRCPAELKERAIAVSGSMNSQDVANVLNALPKLGERSCPAELKQRAIAVSDSMNSQDVANVLNALPKLGEKRCPEELINRLLDETILRELCFGQEYYEQLILDLQKFDNLDEIKSILAQSRDRTILLLHQRLCRPAEVEQEPTLTTIEKATTAQIKTPHSMEGPYLKRPAEPDLSRKHLTPNQIAWMRRQPLVHLLQNCIREDIIRAGDIRRAIEVAKLTVPSSISRLAKIIAVDKDGDIFTNPELHQYLIEQGY